MNNSFSFDNSGLKKIQNNIDKLSSELESVDFTEIFSDKFMKSNTSFSNFEKFIKLSGFDWSTQETVKKIPVEKLNEFVAANTKFSTWEQLFTTAQKQFLEQKMKSLFG